MADLFSRLGRLGRWYDLALLAAALALIVWYFAAWARAMRPRGGTLEWIAMHDRPALSLAGRRFPMERGDALPMAAACAFAAAAWGFAAARTLADHYGGGSAVPAEAAVYAAVTSGVLPALTAGCVYLLGKNLTGSTRAAALCALLPALDLTASAEASAACALASVFLWRFMTAGESFGASCPDLLLAAAALAAGCYFDPAVMIFAAGALLLVLLAGVCRFRSGARGHTAASLLVFLAALAVCTLLLHLPAAVIGGMAFPALLISPAYYEAVLARLLADVRSLGPDPAALFWLLRADWPLALSGLFASVCALAALFRRGEPQGLFLFPAFAAAAAMWALGGSCALSVFCAASLCFVWASLERRGRRGLAAMGAGCLILMLLVLYVLSWLF